MTWSTFSARLDEMSQATLSLQILRDLDGDIRIMICDKGMPVCDESGTKAVVEFCNTAGGGGRSPKTMVALLQLFDAMMADNTVDQSGIPPYPLHVKQEIIKRIGIA